MRRILRLTVTGVAVTSMLGMLQASPVRADAPASTDGKCVYLYVQTNPPTGATVCTPEV